MGAPPYFFIPIFFYYIGSESVARQENKNEFKFDQLAFTSGISCRCSDDNKVFFTFAAKAFFRVLFNFETIRSNVVSYS